MPSSVVNAGNAAEGSPAESVLADRSSGGLPVDDDGESAARPLTRMFGKTAARQKKIVGKKCFLIGFIAINRCNLRGGPVRRIMAHNIRLNNGKVYDGRC
jgi:hypothetical protein